MSYELAITPEAEEDLARLIDSLPRRRRARAREAVSAKLSKLRGNPHLGLRGHLRRPTFRFRFEIDGVEYFWAATFMFSEDERHLVITQIYRVEF